MQNLRPHFRYTQSESAFLTDDSCAPYSLKLVNSGTESEILHFSHKLLEEHIKFEKPCLKDRPALPPGFIGEGTEFC